MTGFLLDTNVPSELIRLHPEPKVAGWLASQTLAGLFISAAGFGELRKGIILRAPSPNVGVRLMASANFG